jgi:hypothetical protein
MYKISPQSTSGSATGDITSFDAVIYKVIRFDKYNITIAITPSNEFLGIVEIGLSKDFLNQEQKIKNYSNKYHDVEEFYSK